MCKFKKLLIILFCSLTLCACSSKKNENKLVFSTWGSQSEIKIITPLVEKFENDNNIDVEIIHIPQNYFQKLHLLFASKKSPDVIFINNYYIPIYQNAGLLLDLTPYFQNEINNDLYFTNAIKSMSIDKKLYAIPRDISNLVIYYNKNLFKKYKIAYPQTNWTYNDLLKIGEKFAKHDIYAIGFEENPLYWEPILWANNASIFDNNGNTNINNTNSLNALKYYIELKNKYKITPDKSYTMNRTNAQLFLDEKIAMHISGRWLVHKYRNEAKFDWDIINLPNGKAGSISSSDSSGWAISKTSPNKDLAVKFIKYMSSNEVINEITKTGLIIPARKDVAYSTTFLDELKPQHAKIFLKINNNAKIKNIPKDYYKKIDRLMKILEPYFLNKKIILQDTKFEL